MRHNLIAYLVCLVRLSSFRPSPTPSPHLFLPTPFLSSFRTAHREEQASTVAGTLSQDCHNVIQNLQQAVTALMETLKKLQHWM
ncbi:hypothetical protein CPC08DRAFT_818820 [Agrocybe pediades]|nr:hypothetical protein CPC08DRAFT_818820 [Agrocybe pediades]